MRRKRLAKTFAPEGARVRSSLALSQLLALRACHGECW